MESCDYSNWRLVALHFANYFMPTETEAIRVALGLPMEVNTFLHPHS